MEEKENMGREMGRQKGKGRGGDRKGKAETDRPAGRLREQRWGTSKQNQRDRGETGQGETERSQWEWRLREQEMRKKQNEKGTAPAAHALPRQEARLPSVAGELRSHVLSGSANGQERKMIETE